MKKDTISSIIIALVILLFIVEFATGGVTYLVGTAFLAISDILFKLGLYMQYL